MAISIIVASVMIICESNQWNPPYKEDPILTEILNRIRSDTSYAIEKDAPKYEYQDTFDVYQWVSLLRLHPSLGADWAWNSQPESSMYADDGTLLIPKYPGVTILNGPPCALGKGTPFISQANIASL